MEEEKKPEKKKKIINKIIVLLLIVVIAVLGVIIYKLLHKEEEPLNRTASEGLIVGDAEEEGEAGTFTTDMNMIWMFPSGKRTSVNAQIGNSEFNEHDVYFEVYLDDEDQTLLYSSPVLPVGKRLKKLKLDKVLEDGEHEALCTFHLLDDKDPDKELSKVSFNVTLIFSDEVVAEVGRS